MPIRSPVSDGEPGLSRLHLSRWRGHWPLFALVLVIAAVHIATLREGHDWSGDNAAYALHARNLIEGRPYGDIGLIHNPATVRDEYYLPHAYPPVLPILLAPVYALWGNDLQPMKTLLVVCFAAGLVALALLVEPRIGRAGALGLVALVGANPVLWQFTDWVVSEFVFIALLCFTLGIASQGGRAEAKGFPGARRGLLVGVGIYLCYATRNVGALLLVALLLADLYRFRRPTAVFAAAVASFVPLALVQAALLDVTSGHLSYKLFHFSPALIWENLTQTYPSIAASFWGNGRWATGSAASAALACGLGAIGFGASLRRREAGVLDAFTLLYLAFFLAIRFTDTRPAERYLIPVFPFLAFYALRGLLALSDRRGFRAAAVGLGVLLAASYAANFSTRDFDPLRTGITSPEAKQVYRFVRENTREDEPVLMWEPRVLTLYTGRPASQVASFWGPDQRRNYARKIGARYWVETRRPLPTSYARVVEPVFANALFIVYRFREPTQSSASGPEE